MISVCPISPLQVGEMGQHFSKVQLIISQPIDENFITGLLCSISQGYIFVVQEKLQSSQCKQNLEG